MRRYVALIALIAATSGCVQSIKESKVKSALVEGGLSDQLAGCMAHRIVERLSLLQLRRLSALGKAEHSRSVDQFLYRVRSLNDSKIVGVTTSSAALCALGVG